MSVINSKIMRALTKLSKCSKYTVVLRNQSVWTPDGIIKSPYKNIEVPNCTLPEYVWKNLDRWPKNTMSICASTGRMYTYEQAYRRSQNFAANLRKKFKLQDGDTVIVMLPNLPEYPIVSMAILEAGGVISTINPVYTATEVNRQLLMAEAKLIITIPEKVNVIKEGLNMAKLDLPIIVIPTNNRENSHGVANFNELSEFDLDKSCLKNVKRSSSDLCFLPYSSGTTGLPKGVELTHKNLVANCEQINEPLIKCHNDTTGSHQDSMLAVLPYFHIYGAVVLMFHKMSLGIKLVTLVFQPDKFINSLEEHKINVLFVAPPLVILMGNHPSSSAQKFQYLETVTNGAAPLATSDVERFFHKVNRDIRFSQGYGLTETSPVVAMGDKYLKIYDVVGNALANTELRIVDANMKNLGPNEKGELLIRGPQVMKGYRNNPKANSESLIDDGWFRTGDLAIASENGVIKVADRLKELIKVKGFQVAPAELEAILREHPSVNDAAVIGIPHPTKGECPKAFVALKPGHSGNLKNITDFVSERVAPFKRIEEIVVIDSIPKSAAGKILRKELKNAHS